MTVAREKNFFSCWEDHGELGYIDPGVEDVGEDIKRRKIKQHNKPAKQQQRIYYEYLSSRKSDIQSILSCDIYASSSTRINT